MNIFASLRWDPIWKETAKRHLKQSEIALIKSAKVVESCFGHSVAFTLKDGEMRYVPCSRTCSFCKVGKRVNLRKLWIVTLSREGDPDIYRIRF